MELASTTLTLFSIIIIDGAGESRSVICLTTRYIVGWNSGINYETSKCMQK